MIYISLEDRYGKPLIGYRIWCLFFLQNTCIHDMHCVLVWKAWWCLFTCRRGLCCVKNDVPQSCSWHVISFLRSSHLPRAFSFVLQTWRSWNLYAFRMYNIDFDIFHRFSWISVAFHRFSCISMYLMELWTRVSEGLWRPWEPGCIPHISRLNIVDSNPAILEA